MTLTYDQQLENYLNELEATGIFAEDSMLEDPPFSNKAKERKDTPVFSGVLHWDRSKSGDELDALTRHLLDHSINPVDDDGVLHLTKVAWRALAALQKELEKKQ